MDWLSFLFFFMVYVNVLSMNLCFFPYERIKQGTITWTIHEKVNDVHV